MINTKSPFTYRLCSPFQLCSQVRLQVRYVKLAPIVTDFTHINQVLEVFGDHWVNRIKVHVSIYILVYLNGNNAAEGENNIKYASSYPMNWTVKNWFVQDFKGHGHDTDEWRDYDEDNVPFERLEKVYVPDEDSLEQRMNIFHGQLYSLYRDNRKFRLPLQLFFW